MKHLLFVVACVSIVGCNGVNRLMNGSESSPQPVKSISSVPVINETPDFGLAVPAGYSRKVYHGTLAMNGVIPAPVNPGDLVTVFMNQVFVNQWFQLGTEYSGAFYFKINTTADTVTIIGQHLENIVYCVYVDSPEARP